METIVKIIWDKPAEKNWLCADNISLALHAYCKNTKFEVVEVEEELYPKEFVEWLNFGSHPFLATSDIIDGKLVNYFTDELIDKKWFIDELFENWKNSPENKNK